MRARRLVPSTRRTSGRAITIRKTKSPMAIITERNMHQRATSRFVVVAVSAMLGMTNCGWGPGLGPTAKVKPP